MSGFYKNLINKLGPENFKRVQDVRIGLAGLGGLGSNCALNLVRTGFRKFTIVDFDTVDITNLDRQFYFLDQVGEDKTKALEKNLRRINPDLDIRSARTRITEESAGELFKDCPIVAECFDSAEAKSMLVARLLSLGKFVVSASGLGGCGLSDDIKVHRMQKNLVMIGDLKSDICSKPAISPRVNIAAAKQADTILEHVLGG